MSTCQNDQKETVQQTSTFSLIVYIQYFSQCMLQYEDNATKEIIKLQILLLMMMDAATDWFKFRPILNHTSEVAVYYLTKKLFYQ